MDWMSHVLITLVSALFLANPVLLERGARQSPNNVRRISAWVMSTFLLLTSMFFSGILILILRLLA